MTMLRGWTISVGLVLAATAANAQAAPQGTSRAGYIATSDFSGPYGDVAPAPPPPAYAPPAYGPPAYGPRAYGPEYGPTEYGPAYGPPLIPTHEVYAVLRENGFSPLDVPHLRGMFYHIVAVDRRGDDGRLVIDARSGQIVRFVPVPHFGDRFGGRPSPYGYGDGYGYGPAPMSYPAGPPRPPIGLPREASRTVTPVPMPRAAPPRVAEAKPIEKPAVEKHPPQPMQQSATAMQGKVVAAAPPPNPPDVIAAKPPAPAILPTQPMPKVQDFE